MKRASRAFVLAAWLGAFALATPREPAHAAEAESADSIAALMACSPHRDGTLDYRARYLKADWVKSDVGGEPYLAMTLLARISNVGGAETTIPNPIVAFHNSVRIVYSDGSAATSKLVVFDPPPHANETITLRPNESIIFGQGAVAEWNELHNHQVVEKKIIVVSEISAKEGTAGEGGWSGCIENRLGEVAFPSVETQERYHPHHNLKEFADELRKQHRLP